MSTKVILEQYLCSLVLQPCTTVKSLFNPLLDVQLNTQQEEIYKLDIAEETMLATIANPVALGCT